jgi:hypothetical protein
MSNKHTPGPWEVFYKTKYDEWHVSVPMSEGNMRWGLFDDGVRSENPEADARLIAAAPDLLKACKALELLFAPLARDCTAADAIDKARAAIAKAEGQP